MTHWTDEDTVPECLLRYDAELRQEAARERSRWRWNVAVIWASIGALVAAILWKALGG